MSQWWINKTTVKFFFCCWWGTKRVDILGNALRGIMLLIDDWYYGGCCRCGLMGYKNKRWEKRGSKKKVNKMRRCDVERYAIAMLWWERGDLLTEKSGSWRGVGWSCCSGGQKRCLEVATGKAENLWQIFFFAAVGRRIWGKNLCCVHPTGVCNNIPHELYCPKMIFRVGI